MESSGGGKDSKSEPAEGEKAVAGVKVVGKELEVSADGPGSDMVGVGTGSAMLGGLNVGRNKARGGLLRGSMASDKSRRVLAGLTGAVGGYCSGGFVPYIDVNTALMVSFAHSRIIFLTI